MKKTSPLCSTNPNSRNITAARCRHNYGADPMHDLRRDTANLALQVVVAFALIGLVFYCVHQVSTGSLKADSAVVGSAFTMFIILVNFCFPNSIGSQKQTDTIATLANAASSPLTTTTTTEVTSGQSSSGGNVTRSSDLAGATAGSADSPVDDADRDYAPS